jgi:hypothetical protein
MVSLASEKRRISESDALKTGQEPLEQSKEAADEEDDGSDGNADLGTVAELDWCVRRPEDGFLSCVGLGTGIVPDATRRHWPEGPTGDPGGREVGRERRVGDDALRARVEVRAVELVGFGRVGRR